MVLTLSKMLEVMVVTGPSWKNYKEELIKQFMPMWYKEDLKVTLLTIRQSPKETVWDYND